MIHHIIPLHEWRIRINPRATRRDKDFNSEINRVDLTVEQHALAHKYLYELNGYEYDRIAYEGLLKFISHEEVVRRVQSLPKSEAHRKKISEKLTGKKNALGVKRTIEQNQKRKLFMAGNSNSVGRFWITNSLGENKCLCKGERIPVGWSRGRNISWLVRYAEGKSY
jgi:hypothetical protein